MANLNHYYKVLELEPGASLEEVKQAYRDLAFVWHPDRYAHNSRLQRKAQQRLTELNNAYEQLQFFLNQPAAPLPHADYQEPERYRSTRVGKSELKTPRKSKAGNTSLPWGWLVGALASYMLTGLILTIAASPLWIWALTVGAAWVGVAVLVSDAASPKAWLVALMVAGGVAGLIVGTEAGGLITGIAWGVAGASLGASAAVEGELAAATVTVTAAGIIAIVGLIAGTGTGDWLGTLIGALFWAVAGFTVGTAVEIGTNSRRGLKFGGLLGLAIGSWVGAGVGAGSETIARALGQAGSRSVLGAWAAIGLVVGVVAEMVAGERLIARWGGLYAFVILAGVSGLGLWLGRVLAHWIF